MRDARLLSTNEVVVVLRWLWGESLLVKKQVFIEYVCLLQKSYPEVLIRTEFLLIILQR